MATLYDTKQHLAFSLQPVMPTADGPANAYDVQLRKGDRVVFERQYTTYPWSPDGHWNVWRLVRACRLASQVLNAKTDFNISGSGGDEFRESTVLQVKTGWLTTVLHGRINRGQHPQPWEKVWFFVGLYLLNGPQLEAAEQSTVPVVHLEMQCVPQAVKAFGDELLAECREALRRRQELGIPAPADDYLESE